MSYKTYFFILLILGFLWLSFLFYVCAGVRGYGMISDVMLVGKNVNFSLCMHKYITYIFFQVFFSGLDWILFYYVPICSSNHHNVYRRFSCSDDFLHKTFWNIVSQQYIHFLFNFVDKKAIIILLNVLAALAA